MVRVQKIQQNIEVEIKNDTLNALEIDYRNIKELDQLMKKMWFMKGSLQKLILNGYGFE